MERVFPEAKPRRKNNARRIFAFVVAALGAVIGWMLGSVFVVAVVGFYGCFRSGYVMGEPNMERPGF